MIRSHTVQPSDDDIELISAYIDDQLPQAQRRALEERLRRDPVLQAALDDLQATVLLLNSVEPVVPPRSFTLDPSAFRSRRTPLFGWVSGGMAATLVILVALVLVIRGGGSQGAVRMAAAPEVVSPLAEGTSGSAAETMPNAAMIPTPMVLSSSDSAVQQDAGGGAGVISQPSPAVGATYDVAAPPLAPIGTAGSISPGTAYLEPAVPVPTPKTTISSPLGLPLSLVVGVGLLGGALLAIVLFVRTRR